MPKRTRSTSMAKGKRYKRRAPRSKSSNKLNVVSTRTTGAKFNYLAQSGFQIFDKTRPFAPDILKTKLVYFDAGVSIDPGVAGTVVSYVYRLNGLYDPSYTGVGHQPTGFDQLMSLYENYYVSNCKAVAYFRATDTTAQSLIGMYVSRDTAPPADYREIIENGNGTSSVLTQASSSGPNSTNTAVLTLNTSICKEMGIPYSELINEDIYGGTSSSNPTNVLYLHIWAAQAVGADETALGLDYVRLEYDAVFKKVKSLAIS